MNTINTLVESTPVVMDRLLRKWSDLDPEECQIVPSNLSVAPYHTFHFQKAHLLPIPCYGTTRWSNIHLAIIEYAVRHFARKRGFSYDEESTASDFWMSFSSKEASHAETGNDPTITLLRAYLGLLTIIKNES